MVGTNHYVILCPRYKIEVRRTIYVYISPISINIIYTWQCLACFARSPITFIRIHRILILSVMGIHWLMMGVLLCCAIGFFH